MESAAKQPVKLVTCPVCSHQVSSQAKSCPNCGHPLVDTLSTREKDEQIRHVGGVVTVALTMLTLGAQTTFLTFTGSSDAGDAGSKTLLRVFLQTAPLTIAIMLIALAHFRNWYPDFGPRLFFTAVTLMTSLFLASVVGGLGVPLSSYGSNFVTAIVNALSFYWRYYGASLFLSSLILGVFLAWALSKRWPGKAPV